MTFGLAMAAVCFAKLTCGTWCISVPYEDTLVGIAFLLYDTLDIISSNSSTPRISTPKPTSLDRCGVSETAFQVLWLDANVLYFEHMRSDVLSHLCMFILE